MQMYITYLHDLALKAAEKYFKAEAELIDILQKIDHKKAFRILGYSSLFSYATKALKLPENTAYTFITVARKAVQILELKAELKTGALNISNAKRIAPILNQANKEEWLEKAKRLPQKKLEQQIAKEFPKQATLERFTYVTETRLNLALGISETLMKKLKRAQDLVSQSKQKPASFEETLEEAIDLFLKKKDPVEIAKQVEAKKRVRVESQAELTDGQNATVESIAKPSIGASQKLDLSREGPRKPLPANIKHAVALRDRGRCIHIDKTGHRCNERRWLHAHHVVPVSAGGTNDVSNLMTLCSHHHAVVHQLSLF